MEEKKVDKVKAAQTILLVFCAAMLTYMLGQQYSQGVEIHKIKVETEHTNVDRALELKADLQRIEDELRVIAYNAQQNVAPSILTAANQAVERTKSLPLVVSSAIFKEGRLQIRFGEEIKKSDTLFGVSLRNGQAICNHGMRTAFSYAGEIPHPLADQFVLVIYRQGNFERNGQRLSGVRPIMRCSIKLTPIDEPETLPTSSFRAD